MFQVCLSMVILLPTTAMWSCGILVRVMLLCSAQLTRLPAVQLYLADLGSGATLIEHWSPLMVLASHTIWTEMLCWFVWTEDPTRVCQWCTLESTAVKYLTKTIWCRHCVWEHILQRVLVSAGECLLLLFWYACMYNIYNPSGIIESSYQPTSLAVPSWLAEVLCETTWQMESLLVCIVAGVVKDSVCSSQFHV